MILETISEEHETQLAGLVGIADFTGFQWQKHYQYLSPYYAKKSAEVVQVRNKYDEKSKIILLGCSPVLFFSPARWEPTE